MPFLFCRISQTKRSIDQCTKQYGNIKTAGIFLDHAIIQSFIFQIRDDIALHMRRYGRFIIWKCTFLCVRYITVVVCNF